MSSNDTKMDTEPKAGIDPEVDPHRPLPGEFRVAREKNRETGEDHLPRLVQVIRQLKSSDPSVKPAVMVRLATNELEYATHRDVLVTEEESGLAYEVLVETDISVPVFDDQLDGPLGVIDPNLGLENSGEPDLAKVDAERIGLELHGPSDPRWAWKQRELRQLQRLGARSFMYLSGLTDET